MWHDVWHSFLWVWVSASQKIPLSVLARNPHKGLAHKISHETKRGQVKESPRVKRSQNTEETRAENGEADSREKETEQTSRQKRAGTRTCGLRSGLANMRGWVSVPSGFVEISVKYILMLAHRCTENYDKVSKTSPFLRLELSQVCICLISFLPPSKLCMLCFVCL